MSPKDDEAPTHATPGARSFTKPEGGVALPIPGWQEISSGHPFWDFPFPVDSLCIQ
jgi:hypothetical protein